MKTPIVFLALLLSNSLAAAEPAPSPVVPAEARAKGDPETRKLSFSLLPKSVQRTPQLDFNVVTEVTTDWRKRGQPTAENPMYFVAQSGGAKSVGEVQGTVKSPSEEQVAKLVERALASRHFLPAVPEHPADVAVIYHWGTNENSAFENSTTVSEDGNLSTEPVAGGSTSDELLPRFLGDATKRRMLIDRAALVGGVEFAVALNASLNDEAATRRTNASSNASASLVGGSMLDANGLMSPFQRFKRRDTKTERLVEEAFGNCFFIILSAVDYASVAKGKPVLLWRTKLSVNSDGVSLAETISPMISAGKDFLGRETDGGILVSKKLFRAGSVELGEAQVAEYLDTPPPAPPEVKKK